MASVWRSAAFLLLCGLQLAQCHRQFMNRIPNSGRVPCDNATGLSPQDRLSACSGTGVCAVFGHNNCQAAGAISPFGKQAGGKPWTLSVKCLRGRLPPTLWQVGHGLQVKCGEERCFKLPMNQTNFLSVHLQSVARILTTTDSQMAMS